MYSNACHTNLRLSSSGYELAGLVGREGLGGIGGLEGVVCVIYEKQKIENYKSTKHIYSTLTTLRNTKDTINDSKKFSNYLNQYLLTKGKKEDYTIKCKGVSNFSINLLVFYHE